MSISIVQQSQIIIHIVRKFASGHQVKVNEEEEEEEEKGEKEAGMYRKGKTIMRHSSLDESCSGPRPSP